MGLFSSLAALFKPAQQSSEGVEPEVYKGYLIYLEPREQGGQYGVGARITRSEEGATQEHHFIRADLFPSRQTCEEITLIKAKTAIDQLGERLFD